MSQALLAIQNILQNSSILNRFRETVLFAPFGDKKVTQFSGFLRTSVSYLKMSKRNQMIKFEIKVTVGPEGSTNRNLKQIITIEFECTEIVIFQLLRPLGISKLAKRELIQ